MKIAGDLGPDALAGLAAEAVGMLCRGEIASLAGQYGYALSYELDASVAIQKDLSNSLSEVGATSLRPLASDPVRSIKYFEANTSNLVAVVECLAQTDNGVSLLVEFIVSSSGSDKHITLEQISAIGV